MSDGLGARLSRVMIRCAESGEGVPTGMRVEAARFGVSDLDDATVKCPHCGREHIWSVSDAWLEEGAC
jgi:hypothetical protein